MGPLRVVCGPRGLRQVQFQPDSASPVPAMENRRLPPLLKEAQSQLSAYFAGKLQTFDLPLDLAGTPFQLRVWQALRDIPFGETRSYGAVAQALGKPGAARAVGGANHENPVAIVVPCHRVIGSSGALVGYAGGMAWKRWLLEHEQIRG